MPHRDLCWSLALLVHLFLCSHGMLPLAAAADVVSAASVDASAAAAGNKPQPGPGRFSPTPTLQPRAHTATPTPSRVPPIKSLTIQVDFTVQMDMRNDIPSWPVDAALLALIPDDPDHLRSVSCRCPS